MRIIAGAYRGRVLCEFDRIGVRPTSDMARESLFNILQMKVPQSVFVDLFAGTGAVGIEALSRGAEKVYFNDLSRESVALVKRNLDKLGIKDDGVKVNVRCGDAELFLKKLITEGVAADVVFIDPPYDSDAIEKVTPYIAQVLSDDGVAVIESENVFGGDLYERFGLIKTDERRYGRAHFTFLKRE